MKYNYKERIKVEKLIDRCVCIVVESVPYSDGSVRTECTSEGESRYDKIRRQHHGACPIRYADKGLLLADLEAEPEKPCVYRVWSYIDGMQGDVKTTDANTYEEAIGVVAEKCGIPRSEVFQDGYGQLFYIGQGGYAGQNSIVNIKMQIRKVHL